MKKLLTILFVLSFIFSKAQYVVPRGLPFKDTRYVNFAAPQGYILIDTLAMFRSSDTAMKPLFPAIKWAYGGFYQWDLTKWDVIGTGATGNFYDTVIQITDTSFFAAKPDGTQDTIEISTTGGGGGGGTGTVTSIATGLGLSGGTITTSGTIVLDTASIVVLSRQRAAATYEPKITPSNTPNQYWNGYKQFVTLNTDSITEGSVNLFYTDARARDAITLTTIGTSGAATYNGMTGVFNIPVYGGRFGIEDNSGVQNRHMNMQGFNFLIDSIGNFDFIAGDPSFTGQTSEIYLDGLTPQLFAQLDHNNYSQIITSYGGVAIASTNDGGTTVSNVVTYPDSLHLSSKNGSASTILSITPTTAKMQLNNATYEYLPLSVNNHFADANGAITIPIGGSGTVTSFAATDGNGFDFTVTNPTTTPTLTATTTVADTRIMYSGTGAITGSANLTYASNIVTSNNPGIGITRTDGLVLQNTTAATSILEQYSPSLVLEGRSWRTASGGSSNTNKWAIFNRTAQGVSTTSSTLVIQSTDNAGTYADVLTLTGQTSPVLTVQHIAATVDVTTPAFPSNASGFWTWGNGVKLFGGTAYNLQLANPGTITTDQGYKLDAYGAIQSLGSVVIGKLATPSSLAAATTGTAGSTTITYKVVAKLVNGATTDAGSVTISTANATLTTSNFVTITGAFVPGAFQYLLYRSATNGTSPNTTGLISTISVLGASIFFTDKGTVAGGGEVAPTVNTTGNLGVGISTPQAALDVSSTTQGALLPRMTTTQRDAIASPPEGSIIYNLTTHKLNLYTGSAWEVVTSL